MVDILYSTEDLARMFRVGKSTIKRWTDEGKLQCFKTPGGHRKFKPSNVHEFINQYHYEIIEPILPFARTKETIEAAAVTIAVEPLIEECFLGAIKGRRETVRSAFTQLMLQGKPLSAMLDALLTPVTRMVHSRYQQHQITSVEFHVAKNTLIHELIHLSDKLPKTDRKNVELYCLSVHEGMNEVELKAVEVLLDTMGMTVYNLGTVLTKYAAEDIVNQCKPEDVFVVISLDRAISEVSQQFETLVDGVTAYGGNVFTSHLFNDSQTPEVRNVSKQFNSFAEIAQQFTTETANVK